MTYEASPRRSEFLGLVARLVFCVGSIVAFWLIAPTAARALEPSTDLDEPTDTVDETADAVENTLTEASGDLTDAVDGTADAVENTLTEAAGDLTDAVDETADTAENTLTEAAGEPAETVAEATNVDRQAKTVRKFVASVTGGIAGSARDTVARVQDLADDPGSTLQEAGDATTDIVVRPLQDAVPTVDLDGVSFVVATVGSVTAPGTSGPRTHDGERLVESADRGDIPTARAGDEPSFGIRGPPLTTGLVAAAAISDGGVAPAPSSDAAPSAPGRSDALPAAAASTARSFPRDGSSFDDLAAILAALMIALCLGRWSVREAELNHLPLFLRLAERPG